MKKKTQQQQLQLQQERIKEEIKNTYYDDR